MASTTTSFSIFLMTMRMSNANIIKETLLILAAFLFGWAETYAQRLSYFSEENDVETEGGIPIRRNE